MAPVLRDNLRSCRSARVLAMRYNVMRPAGKESYNSGIWQQLRLASTLAAPLSKNLVVPLPPPLSILPMGMLLRSLLIATISSKRLLLLPSLSILTFLSNPGRSYFLNVDRNPLLHAILKRTFYNQFCAGENKTETKETIQQLKQLGFRGIILTYARETVFDHLTNTEHTKSTAVSSTEKGSHGSVYKMQQCPDIEAWKKGTLETIDLINEGDYLALKLSGAGPTATVPFSLGELPPQQMMDALDEICTRSKNRKIRILVDAESQRFQRGIARVTLELMRKYNRDGLALIYNTYQAYLKSTPDLLQKHLDVASKYGFTLGLKLVRGAYIASDERSLIHDTKQDTDNAYNIIAQGVLKQHIGNFGPAGNRPFPSVNLFLASHNKASLMAAYELSQQRAKAGLPTVPVGFGQLHGMSDEVSFSLLQLRSHDGKQVSPDVYKCSTWGSLGECLAYLTRRAIENRDAVSRTTDEYNALKQEIKRRFKSIFTSSAST